MSEQRSQVYWNRQCKLEHSKLELSYRIASLFKQIASFFILIIFLNYFHSLVRYFGFFSSHLAHCPQQTLRFKHFFSLASLACRTYLNIAHVIALDNEHNHRPRHRDQEHPVPGLPHLHSRHGGVTHIQGGQRSLPQQQRTGQTTKTRLPTQTGRRSQTRPRTQL